MEMAVHVKHVFEELNPDCVAVELPETMQPQLHRAASRLPDISLVVTYDKQGQPLYIMCEPCDALFEGLRSALDLRIPSYCIDLDVDAYPNIKEAIPDPYAIQRIGMKSYYKAYEDIILAKNVDKTSLDMQREIYLAHRLKELSFSYDRILFIGGMFHVKDVLNLMERSSFPALEHCSRDSIELITLTENSCREVMAECGWFTSHYERQRQNFHKELFDVDRQKLMLQLYKEAAIRYQEEEKQEFAGYHLRNMMKFVRNYALINDRLMPDLYQILTAAKGCVDHNYAYHTWDLATTYPYRKNVDALPEHDLTIEEVWGHSKIIRFHMKQQRRKGFSFHPRSKDRAAYRFEPPSPFAICSYPPEDVVVENFGSFLQKKGTQILSDEGTRTVPFSTSLEDGIDTRETIRHWPEKKLYVKMHGKPPGGVGSIVVIFDEDSPKEGDIYHEKYPWYTTWLGEHDQESDMAFYATNMGENIVGPGISKCEYGGFMMSYPPRRMFDVWLDADYGFCNTKPEVLLAAAIDYAVKPIVVYVANQPPKQNFKVFAQRFGKKIVYIPIGQLSPVTMKKIRFFHVLEGHHRRDDADRYI